MCGRFSITTYQEMLEQRFDARFDDDFLAKNQAFPSESLPVITSESPQKIQLFEWGLQPQWLAKIASARKSLINVRAETLKNKKTFQRELESGRCLVLADGFYEWKKEGDKKIPFYIQLKNKKPFAFAGLWHNMEKQDRFAIITTAPNELVSKIHNRMPAILPREDERKWIDQNSEDTLIDLLQPYPQESLSVRRLK